MTARPAAAAPPIALWVGPECTVNRVGDTTFDQLEASGFARRLDDIDRLAALNPQRVRFPLLWERTAPDAPERCDWRWADERLQRLQALGVEPIVGLVHHGSGPRYTHLLDPAFPQQLAAYARAVAERYPHVTAYTPVNEPLTTARFSGLYGVWYPHAASDRTFVLALLHQVQATVLAMRAIREVQPAAELVQTDDLGHTLATPPVAEQAAFDNERRWLGWDLLCGRVDRAHPLWNYLLSTGIAEAALHALVEQPCPPDIVGVNSYVTSERFLDHRLERYPPHLHGGNGRQAYVDIEAVRVCGAEIGGFAARLREAHARYGLPLAITEAHIGCTREEQLRWLQQAWDDAHRVRAEGADVRAVCAWAAFGTYDWDSLCTRRQGHYEPGLYDVRGPQPRLTAVGALAQRLGASAAPSHPPHHHPVLHGPGWWQRELRRLYAADEAMQARPLQGPPLLITGATGTLGRAFARLCEERGLPYHLLTRAEMDIADPPSVQAALRRWRPWALVNTAGYVRVDDAEHDAERQWRENALGPAVLASACARAGLPLLTFSSDLVFDGLNARPYAEDDAPRPLNAYGRAKHAAELEVLSLHPQALVVRAAAFFGPWDRHNFLAQGLARLRRGEPWEATDEMVVSPTYVPDLVQASLDLLVDGEHGLWHLASEGAVDWAGFARLAAQAAGLDAAGVQPVPATALGWLAPRPRYSALRSTRAQLMPPLDDALRRFVAAQAGQGASAAPL